ncbi:MAG: hypothetical protein HOP13_07895 [Alphaproteobacteria bacterium]|nr:hypothetical protein [Alphaproteobacteria bacterium]
MRFLCLAVLALVCSASGYASPNCERADIAELCTLAKETRADNPEFGAQGQWTTAALQERSQRHATRRKRAVDILNDVANPTWRDLYNAGYAIFYGETPEERLLAHAIAIRALSLAPDEPEARHFVAMTFDKIGRSYVGAQLYGRQKFFKLNPATSEVESSCLPQMIDPPLPASVGTAFEAWPKGFDRCPKGVGEIPQARPIGDEPGKTTR